MLCVQALMEKIFTEFTFDGEATQVATPLVEVLERRRGVCQDFAHLRRPACVRGACLPDISVVICGLTLHRASHG